MDNVFAKTAGYYDKIYAGKDYAGEVERLRNLIKKRHPSAQSLLDVACGTGRHVEYLKKHFEVQGVDICEELLAIARKRNPDVTFHYADMTDFGLDQEFDIVVCLFSSIGYVRTMEKLHSAVRCMACHLKPGGLLIIEPWLRPNQWQPNTVHGLFIDEPDLKIARINTSFVEGRVSIFDLHHLIGTPERTEHVVEHHEMGLFETEEMESVLEEQNLTVEYDPEGLTERGLFVGKRNE